MIITSDLACPGQDQSSSKRKPGKRNNFNLLTKSESIVISRLGRESKGVFGLPVSVTQFSVSINHNSKMVGAMTKKLFGKR